MKNNYTHADSGGEALTLDKLKKVQREFYSTHGVEYDPQLAIKYGENYARAARVIEQARTAHVHPADLQHTVVQQLKKLDQDRMLPGYIGGIAWISSPELPPGQVVFSTGNGLNARMVTVKLYDPPEAPEPPPTAGGTEDPPEETDTMYKKPDPISILITLILTVALIVLVFTQVEC